MKSEVYWADNSVAVIARPRGADWLEDEVKSLSASGLNIIVSLLSEEEEIDLNLTKECDECLAAGLDYFSFPIVDRSIPTSIEAVFDFVAILSTLIRDGKKIGIHCRQGIGRSPLIAAAVLVKMGTSPDEAFQKISLARGVEVPETPEQKAWLDRFAMEF